MPSIFIWKAQSPINSKRTIRYYSGDSWVLEDNEYSSLSYVILEQLVISGSNNESVIIYNTKKMPQDWVGSELLEVTQVPYQFIKQDEYGTFDRLGDWMRFTSKNELQFDTETLEKEFTHIQSWMNDKPMSKPIARTYQKTMPNTQENILNPERIKLNFQEFLIKYTSPLPNEVTNNTHSSHRKQQQFNTKFKNNKSKNFQGVRASA